MSSSLREQLIQAGLATEKQVKQVSHEQRQRGRSQRQPAPAAEKRLAQQQQTAKAARDQELNRQRQAKAEKKARLAEIRQLIEQARVARPEGGDRFNFVDEKRIRFLSVDAAQREQIHRGALVIVRYGRSHELVPAEAAARIRERDERSVISIEAPPPQVVDENDPYKDFQVPDDLTW